LEDGSVCPLDPSERKRVRLQAALVMLNSLVVGIILTATAILTGMFVEAKVW
jgi:hypothetical protein